MSIIKRIMTKALKSFIEEIDKYDKKFSKDNAVQIWDECATEVAIEYFHTNEDLLENPYTVRATFAEINSSFFDGVTPIEEVELSGETIFSSERTKTFKGIPEIVSASLKLARENQEPVLISSATWNYCTISPSYSIDDCIRELYRVWHILILQRYYTEL